MQKNYHTRNSTTVGPPTFTEAPISGRTGTSNSQLQNTGFTTARNDNSISAFNTKTPNGSFGFVDI